MSLPVKSVPLKVPESDEVRAVIETGLKQNFKNVDVQWVDCPKLTEPPYNLAGEGLSGKPRISEVGGIPNLVPIANQDKNYKFSDIAQLMDLPNAFMMGAGAGPLKMININSEMMGNVVTGNNPVNKSQCSIIQDDCCQLKKLSVDQSAFSIMFNIFASEGAPGKVLRIRASQRTGEENFVSCIRKTLTEKYGADPVGMGGFFRLLGGAAKCHVMPCFSATPLDTPAQVNEWLRFIDMPAPMTFFSVLVSADPGLDLRLEHSHGHGETLGGHYHYDVTPQEVSYEGFYNIAEILYRIDPATPVNK